LASDFVVVVATIAYQPLLLAMRLLCLIRRNCDSQHVLTAHNQTPTGNLPTQGHSQQTREGNRDSFALFHSFDKVIP